VIGGGVVRLDGQPIGAIEQVRVDYDRVQTFGGRRGEDVPVGVDIQIRINTVEDARAFADRITEANPDVRIDALREENRKLLELAEIATVDPANPASPAQRAAAAMARVRALHRPEHTDQPWGGQCYHCSNGYWPCETIKALEGQ